MKANAESSLIVCDYYDTGLLKNGEAVAIESIEGLDENFKNEFKAWLNEARELLQPFAFTFELVKLYRPRLADIKYHNINGIELAMHFKSVVGDVVRVYYSCIDISLLTEQTKKNR